MYLICDAPLASCGYPGLEIDNVLRAIADDKKIVTHHCLGHITGLAIPPFDLSIESFCLGRPIAILLEHIDFGEEVNFTFDTFSTVRDHSQEHHLTCLRDESPMPGGFWLGQLHTGAGGVHAMAASGRAS